MELKVTRNNDVIELNFDELKKEITEKAKLYKSMVYDENSIAEAKTDRAKLSKFKTVLDTKRKEVKKEVLTPYEHFEKQIKELMTIIDEPIKSIDVQTRAYENKRKEEKFAEIEKLFSNTGFQEWVKLEAIFDDKWLNKGSTFASIKKAMQATKEKIESDIAILQSTDCSTEATEFYKKTMDLKGSIKKAQEFKAIADVVNGLAEAVGNTDTDVLKKAEPVKPTEEVKDGPKEWVKLSVYGSEKDFDLLAEFFASHGIEYEMI